MIVETHISVQSKSQVIYVHKPATKSVDRHVAVYATLHVVIRVICYVEVGKTLTQLMTSAFIKFCQTNAGTWYFLAALYFGFLIDIAAAWKKTPLLLSGYTTTL